jgi:ribosomal protein L16 Arg81 hydroxylase
MLRTAQLGVHDMSEALRRLLEPTNAAEFLSNYWGRDCLLNKGDAARFHDLFTWPAIEALLATQRFDFPRLRLVRKGKVIPAAQYMTMRTDRRGNPYTTHVSTRIATEMKKGAMLHIAAVHDGWQALSQFTARLELDLCARVQVNLHAALARSKGFSTHWDGHDVFVIQVAGRKAWRLFGFTELAPVPVAPDQKGEPPTAVVREIVLETGDMLYVPRGYWHAAEALEDISLHLTFAVQYPTGNDYLMWVTRRLENDPLARRDIPFGLFEQMSDPGDGRSRYARRLLALVGESVGSMDEYLQEFQAGLGKTNYVHLLEE